MSKINIFSVENRDITNTIFSHAGIISLIKFRCVLKYLQILANNYIEKNEKLCDMLAYGVNYLLTPEYLVINNVYLCLTKMDRGIKLDYRISEINITTIIVNHINIYNEKLRLVKSREYNPIDCRVKLVDLHMLKLKYLIINNGHINFSYIPCIRYCSTANHINQYMAKTFYMGIISEKVTETNENIINLVVNHRNDIYCIKYFPNTKNLYYDDATNDDINNFPISNSVKKLYINYTSFNFNITKIYPNLNKIYIDNFSYFSVGNITINSKIYYNVGLTLYKTNHVIKQNNEINIICANDYVDLFKIYTDINIINICCSNNIIKFRLGNIKIKKTKYDYQIKKLVFK